MAAQLDSLSLLVANLRLSKAARKKSEKAKIKVKCEN